MLKEKTSFPIFNTHLDLAHNYWEKVIQKGDWAIDATCGNGHDTLFLAGICEGVIGLDVQKEALDKTRKLTKEKENIFLYQQSHETFPQIDKPIRLIVYNLGYLPGGDKKRTTFTASTLNSVANALELILPGGVVSVTCYGGHEEGKREEEALLSFSETLHPSEWSVCFHRWNNRKNAPSLLLFQKKIVRSFL